MAVILSDSMLMYNLISSSCNNKDMNLSLYEVDIVDIAVGVSSHQFAVELRPFRILATSGRRRDLPPCGQVEVGRSENLSLGHRKYR